MESDEFLAAARTAEPAAGVRRPRRVAVVLFTSGTTSQPESRRAHPQQPDQLRHRHRRIRFGRTRRRRADLCAAVSHRRRRRGAVEPVRRPKDGVSARSSTPASGCAWSATKVSPRRPSCPPCSTASSPCWRRSRTALPTLRTWPTAGPRSALPLVRKALELLPEVGFVNAYGLTETSSTIAVLDPRRPPRRLALRRRRGRRAARLGRPAGARHRGADPRRGRHRRSAPGETGELFVRGEQVSGRYTGIGSVLDDEGWFPTKDVAIARRRRLPVHRRPLRRHHHPRRREHRARRDRGRPRRASACARLRGRRRRGSRVGPDHRRGRGPPPPAPNRHPMPTTCATTSARSCADHAPPTGSCSATNCRPTRPARCCAANSSTN